MNKKTKKLAFNISVIIVLLLALGWVCSRFIHWGNVEFTDNAQVRQHIGTRQLPGTGFHQENLFYGVSDGA